MRVCSSSLFSIGLVTCTIFPTKITATDMPSPDDERTCTGLSLDFSRLVDVTNNDLNTVAAINGGDMFLGRSYGFTSITPVTNAGTSECMLQRHRLKETKNNVAIFGAEAIVTVADCSPPDNTAFGGGYVQTPLSGIPVQYITNFEGKTYTEIGEDSDGLVPTRTQEEVITALATFFDTPIDKVGTLHEIIFPSSERGDFLSYRSEVWVTIKSTNDIQLFDVFISAHTLEILQICKKMNIGQSLRRRVRRHQRKLRQDDNKQNENHNMTTKQKERELQNSMCASCASQDTVTWSSIETNCTINSLYMNNENRTTTCVIGEVNGEEVLGPGLVKDLHYAGTYDCNGGDQMCSANALPTDCSDSLSDVHYGVTETLKFYQRYLGVMGGLNVNANDSLQFASFVHFGDGFCNAFFTTETNSLYFGDCNCELWKPMVSLDIAAHELTHGITAQSSGLVYYDQPGGLNEGYSDIIGATMEYLINDSIDTPDFTLGENIAVQVGKVIRDMENPPVDGKSIDNVCDMNEEVQVHHSSGVINNAFTAAVRACQESGCAEERECVLLLGPLFMYANIHKLTALSGFLDSASQTCAVVDEYYTARSPVTTCQVSQAKDFIRAGWAASNVQINEECRVTATEGCTLDNSVPNCLDRVRTAFSRAFAWILRPFNSPV